MAHCDRDEKGRNENHDGDEIRDGLAVRIERGSAAANARGTALIEQTEANEVLIALVSGIVSTVAHRATPV